MLPAVHCDDKVHDVPFALQKHKQLKANQTRKLLMKRGCTPVEFRPKDVRHFLLPIPVVADPFCMIVSGVVMFASEPRRLQPLLMPSVDRLYTVHFLPWWVRLNILFPS